MKLVRTFIFGLIVSTLLGLSGCKDTDGNIVQDEHGRDAKAVMTVSPSTEVSVGSRVVFDSANSKYSGDNIEWYQDGALVSSCEHEDICILYMDQTGQTIITLRVRVADVEFLGNTVSDESEDETAVVISVI